MVRCRTPNKRRRFGRRPGGLSIPNRPDRRAVYRVDSTPPLAHASIQSLRPSPTRRRSVQYRRQCGSGSRGMWRRRIYMRLAILVLAGLMLGGLNGGPSMAFAQARHATVTDSYRFPEPSAVATGRRLRAANIHEHAAARRGGSRHRIRWFQAPELRFGAPRASSRFPPVRSVVRNSRDHED
jgi:hypothetical protein